MSEEKIYIGSGREKTFDNGGAVINAIITLDGLKKHFEDYGFTTDQGKKMLKIIIGKRKETDQYGRTHWIALDTWKPNSTGNLDSGGETF